MSRKKNKHQSHHPKAQGKGHGPKPPRPQHRPTAKGPRSQGPSQDRSHDRSQGRPGAREVVGIVQASDRGFGFFIPEDGTGDAFLNPREMRNLVNGDTIKARVTPDRQEGRFSAEVLSIVKRKNTTLVGTLSRESGHWTLKPEDPRIPHWVKLLPGKVEGKAGEKAVARITRWPGEGPGMEGILEEILGSGEEPGVDMLVVIRKHQWPDRFPAEAERQAEKLPENPGEADFKGRLDLRKVPLLTIDGKDARDFDDAVSLENLPDGGWKLGVHIADVSHYVQPGSPLDLSARERSTSLYLPDRVLPMFPHSLSDGLCSLREGVPRLTVSAFLEYDRDGNPGRTHFASTVILSRRRGIYDEIQRMLDGTADGEIRRKYEDLLPMLREMVKLSALIRLRREAAGSLDFDLPEVRAVLDEKGVAIDVRKVERLGTHKLIEDFMVAANEAVATFLTQRKAPALYRIHEPPSAEDSSDLAAVLKAYRIPFKEGALSTPLGLQDLLKRIKGHPLEATLTTLTLRSLTMAVYATRNAGHFGLGLKSYCHFTSPIRRYPDVVVHRALKLALGESGGHRDNDLAPLGKHTSLQERAAEKAEREGQKVKQLGFMEKKIGETAEGRVTHLTAKGCFVELDPWGVEGFIPMEMLSGGPYQFDEVHLRFSGRRGQIKMGDPMRVRIDSVDRVLQRLGLKQL